MSDITEGVTLDAPDGPCQAYAAGSGPGVLLIMDAIGLRPQISHMVEEIAGWGYAVLAPNVLYRSGRVEDIAPTEDLREEGARERFFKGAMRRVAGLTPQKQSADLPTYLAALRERAAGPEVAVVGYCMGARLAVRAAGLDRDVVAVAGFHGGGLVTEAPDSPHRAIPGSRAEFVFGHAHGDRSMTPDQVAELGRTLDAAGATATNEVYAGPHGYTMADSSAYDEPSARRAADALHALLDRTLAR